LKNINVKNLEPLLKWVVGKQSLTKQISAITPCEIKNLYNSFGGCGISFLIIISLIKKN